MTSIPRFLLSKAQVLSVSSPMPRLLAPHTARIALLSLTVVIIAYFMYLLIFPDSLSHSSMHSPRRSITLLPTHRMSYPPSADPTSRRHSRKWSTGKDLLMAMEQVPEEAQQSDSGKSFFAAAATRDDGQSFFPVRRGWSFS